MVATDEGDVRIRFADASRSNLRKIFEAPTEALDIATDPRQQLIVPFTNESIHEDDLVIVEVKVGTASTADYGLSTVRIPITKRNKSTGQETPTYLRDSDLRSADVTLTANTWVELGSYTVSAQEDLKLGHRIPDNSRVYISFTENA
jgi:hypothetical protein